jgi:hypothetical protein
MFQKTKDMLQRLFHIEGYLEVMRSDLQDTRELMSRMLTQSSDIRVWVELLADAKADEVADEFGRLLVVEAEKGVKLTNIALKQLVHQAVINVFNKN